jgi:hypothetical protein
MDNKKLIIWQVNTPLLFTILITAYEKNLDMRYNVSDIIYYYNIVSK